MDIANYMEVNLLCVIILLLFVSQTRHKTEQFSSARIAFLWLIWASIVLCVTDMAACLSAGRFYQGAQTVLEISNLLYFEALTVASFSWLIYTMIQLNMLDRNDRKTIRLLAIPLAVFTLMLATNPMTHFLFAIDEGNVYHRGAGVIVHWIVTWGYLAAATVLVARALLREKNRYKRRRIAPLLCFILPPIVAGIAQMLFDGLSSTQAGLTVGIVTVFLYDQRNQVLIDNLTGLNNRRSFQNYIGRFTARRSRDELSILLADVDEFSSVNNRFGHLAGDYALQEIGKALMRACASAPGKPFLCKFGGDVFLMADVNRSEADRDEWKRLVREGVEKVRVNGDDSYAMKISIGTAHGSCANDEDVENLIHLAQDAMYREKSRAKAEKLP